jgi:hypothetical protein
VTAINDRPVLSSKRAPPPPQSTKPQKSDSNENLVGGPRWGLTPGLSGRMPAGRYASLTCMCVWRGPVGGWVPAGIPPRRGGVTPPLVEKEAPLLNTFMSVKEQKYWSWVPTGLRTKNYCAGEGQQQFNRPTVNSLVQLGPATLREPGSQGSCNVRSRYQAT